MNYFKVFGLSYSLHLGKNKVQTSCIRIAGQITLPAFRKVSARTVIKTNPSRLTKHKQKHFSFPARCGNDGLALKQFSNNIGCQPEKELRLNKKLLYAPSVPTLRCEKCKLITVEYDNESVEDSTKEIWVSYILGVSLILMSAITIFIFVLIVDRDSLLEVGFLLVR